MTDDSLAARLAAAFDTADIVVPRAKELPADIDAAERVEDAIAAKLGPIGGYKLGATIPSVRAGLGLSRCFFGIIPKSRIFQDGAAVPARVARQRGIECEYAFRFGQDLSPDETVDAERLWASIDAVHPAIEIPGTRFERLAGFGGFGLVADLGAVGSLVLGAAVPLAGLSRLGDAPVTLEIEGEPAVLGSGAVIEGGPTGPLLDFCRRARARGYAIRSGDVVATGSCTGYVDIELGRIVTARFAALEASVTMHFSRPFA